MYTHAFESVRVTDLASRRILSYRTTDGSLRECRVSVKPRSWQELPSLYPVVNGLASLKLGEIREVAQQVIQGASDCSTNKRVEF